MTEPPVKKIKPGQEFVDLINECYDLKFNTKQPSEEEHESLKLGMQKIRKALTSATSNNISFGQTKTSVKIHWGKCLGLLLEDGPYSLGAIKVLTEKLSPGGGLLC